MHTDEACRDVRNHVATQKMIAYRLTRVIKWAGVLLITCIDEGDDDAKLQTRASLLAILSVTLQYRVTMVTHSHHSQLKAKFHYAIMDADRSEAGRRPAASWNLAYHLVR